ncbi:MAG: archaetidylserine decarboxylase [Crocinitomicaceae bacterium]
MKEVKFIDRQTGETVIETVPGGGMMHFFYSQNVFGKFLLWAFIKRRLLSVMVGWFMMSSISVRSVKSFIKKNKIDLKDYQVPKGYYKHFNSFFYRKLKPGARVIGEGVISPADGKVLVFPTIAAAQSFYVKGQQFDLNKFFLDKKLAAEYDGGALAIVRLAPTDYHRFHFPIDGYVGETIKYEGDYYSVSPIALKQNMRIFCENKREFVSVDSDKYGSVVLAEIGATLTGSIVQSHWPNIDVIKGQEKGFFAFGGSTVIVLFKKGKIRFSSDLIKNTKNGFETAVKMGETIGGPLN